MTNVANGKGGSEDFSDVASAGNLILLSLFSRILTLLISQIQVRLTSAEVIGAFNIHFGLLIGLILTFSRDGFRTALSRSRYTKSASVRNVALLPIPIGIILLFTILSTYAKYLAPIELTNHQDFNAAMRNFLLGIAFEILAEPLYIKALISLDTRTRVQAEGTAITIQSIVTLATSWMIQDSLSLLPYSLGQVSYGSTMLCLFVGSTYIQNGSKFTIDAYKLESIPVKQQNVTILTYFDNDTLHLTWSMTAQNIFKHILGAGDKFAVAKLASLSDQGAYALASNYASLIASIIYAPLEESSRLTFARALGDNKTTPSSISLDMATSLIINLLSFYVLLSLFLITFCPTFSTTVLLLLAGRRWAFETSTPTILAIYGSTYLPIMAFNGLLEGFLQSTATPVQLTRYSFVLGSASASFIISLAAFHHFHLFTAEKSLVIATAVSMSIRAIYSYFFTTSFIKEKQMITSKSISSSSSISQRHPHLAFNQLVPHRITMVTFATSFAIVFLQPHTISQSYRFGLSLPHLLTSVACATICAATCVIYERDTLYGTLAIIRGRIKQRNLLK